MTLSTDYIELRLTTGAGGRREPYLAFLRSQHSHHIRLARGYAWWAPLESSRQYGIARGLHFAAIRYIEDIRTLRTGGHR